MSSFLGEIFESGNDFAVLSRRVLMNECAPSTSRRGLKTLRRCRCSSCILCGREVLLRSHE